MGNLLEELKRRNVVKASISYVILCWAFLQAADIIFPIIGIGDEVLRLILIGMICLFPVWVIFAYFYEWTDHGFKLTSAVKREESQSAATSKRLNQYIIAGLSLAVILLLLDRVTNFSDAVMEVEVERSIAVLPFDNLGDAGTAYFAEGITEDILTQLSKVSDLRVLSKVTLKEYDSESKTIQEIGEDLGVEYLLTGSIRKSLDEIRVSCQLIQVNDQSQRWAENFDRKLVDVFQIQSEVAKNIAGQLQSNLTVQEQQLLDKSPTQNMESYSLYLKGRSRYYTYTTEGMQDAIELFKIAIAKDVSFALAYAGLADAYAQAAASYGLLPVSYLDSARILAEMSVQIDPTLAEGWKALGLNYQYRGKLRQAQASYETALKYNPNYYPAVSNLVPVYGLQNLFHKAMETAAKTLQLDPLKGSSYVSYADGLRFLRMTDSALVVLDKGLKMDPGSNGLWFTRAKALIDMERNKEAEASLRMCIELDTSLSFGFRAADHALLFDTKLAKEFTRGASLEILQDSIFSPLAYSILAYLSENEDTTLQYLDAGIAFFEKQLEQGNASIDFTQHLTFLYAMRGESEKALKLLEQDIMKRGLVHLMELELDPRLENIRTDPRFEDLLDYIRQKTGKWRMELTGGNDFTTENL